MKQIDKKHFFWKKTKNIFLILAKNPKLFRIFDIFGFFCPKFMFFIEVWKVLGKKPHFWVKQSSSALCAGQKKPAATIGLYKLKELKDASRYGVVRLDRDDKVIHFEEKPKHPKSKLVAMCLYYIPAGRLSLIKDYMKIGKKADATGNYIDWLKDRIDTYGFVFHGYWYDIGDFKYLTAARNNFAN